MQENHAVSMKRKVPISSESVWSAGMAAAAFWLVMAIRKGNGSPFRTVSSAAHWCKSLVFMMVTWGGREMENHFRVLRGIFSPVPSLEVEEFLCPGQRVIGWIKMTPTLPTNGLSIQPGRMSQTMAILLSKKREQWNSLHTRRSPARQKSRMFPVLNLESNFWLYWC